MPPKDEGKSIDIRSILSIVIKRKWLIVLPLILVAAVAYGATYFLVPMYRSSCIIWIDKPHNVSRELVNLLGREGSQRVSSDDRRQQLRALQNELTSQSYLTMLIRDLGLDRDPELVRQSAKMREDNPDMSMEQLKYHLLFERLRDRIGVSYVGADQIRIAVESGEPALARDMVTRLAEILEQEKTRYEMDKILDNQSFADLQLQRTEYQYNITLDSLSAARARLTSAELPVGISSPDNRREIQSDIEETTQELDDFKDELSSLKVRLAEFGLEAARLRYTDSLVEMRTDLEEETTSLASLMEKYRWTEPDVININIRIRDNLRLLEQELSRVVDQQFASYPTNQRDIVRRNFIVKEHIDVFTSKRSHLRQNLEKLEHRIYSIPQIQTEIDELDRRVVDARRYRDAFRSEESTVEILSERAKDRTKYKVIEPAQVPLAPFYPDKTKIMMMGILLGMVIGGAAVFLAEVLDNSFKSVDDAEVMLGLPVLATIPKIERLRVKR